MYYKKKKGKKNKCKVFDGNNSKRQNKKNKQYGGLTPIEFEALCNKVKLKEKKYRVLLTVY